jgi:uncharacterized repeat protein (TIGR03806 family)
MGAGQWPVRRGAIVCTALLAVLLVAGCGQAGITVPATDPLQLSSWQLMRSDGQQLLLADGVVPYMLNAPLFTDYAHKLRTVSLPAGQAATVNADGSLDFPVGTVISKTFFYPRAATGVARLADTGADLLPALGEHGGLDLTSVQLVETRLLVHRPQGWVGLPYVWNAEQTEALLEVTGDIKSLTLVHGADATPFAPLPFAYVVPDQNQCGGCHGTNTASKQINPIGPHVANLNRTVGVAYGSSGNTAENQLQLWQQQGLLILDTPVADYPAMVAWQDPQQSLAGRARSYLHSNCGHCHSSTGPADTSGLYLDQLTTNPVRLGECKLPIAAGQGTGGHQYSIVPGEPAESILIYRMQTRDPGAMMPELGRSLVHTEGVDLVSEWIAQLPGGCA